MRTAADSAWYGISPAMELRRRALTSTAPRIFVFWRRSSKEPRSHSAKHAARAHASAFTSLRHSPLTPATAMTSRLCHFCASPSHRHRRRRAPTSRRAVLLRGSGSPGSVRCAAGRVPQRVGSGLRHARAGGGASPARLGPSAPAGHGCSAGFTRRAPAGLAVGASCVESPCPRHVHAARVAARNRRR